MTSMLSDPHGTSRAFDPHLDLASALAARGEGRREARFRAEREARARARRRRLIVWASLGFAVIGAAAFGVVVAVA
jgi:hypothetical protein